MTARSPLDATATGAPPAARRSLPQGFKRRLLGQMIGEVGPLLVFFVVFAAWGILAAAAAYAGATLLSLAIGWYLRRRLPVLPLVSAGLVTLFAGLTIALDDALFIKIKPTVTNGFFAAAIGIGWLFGFRLLPRILAPNLVLDSAGERLLTLRVTLYLAALAAANEVVWRSVSLETWVLFKVFVLVALNLLFGWSQLALLRRHRIAAAPGRPGA